MYSYPSKWQATRYKRWGSGQWAQSMWQNVNWSSTIAIPPTPGTEGSWKCTTIMDSLFTRLLLNLITLHHVAASVTIWSNGGAGCRLLCTSISKSTSTCCFIPISDSLVQILTFVLSLFYHLGDIEHPQRIHPCINTWILTSLDTFYTFQRFQHYECMHMQYLQLLAPRAGALRDFCSFDRPPIHL